MRREAECRVRTGRLPLEVNAGLHAQLDESVGEIEDMTEEEHVRGEGMNQRATWLKLLLRGGELLASRMDRVGPKRMFARLLSEPLKARGRPEEVAHRRKLAPPQVGGAHVLIGVGFNEGGSVGGFGSAPSRGRGNSQGGLTMKRFRGWLLRSESG